YPAKSPLARWLRDPFSSARPYNERDLLIKEVLFAVHDYLHGWTYGAIRELRPELGFGSAPVTARNAEDFAFCHLATEAAAVVGLDYWHLSTLDLNAVCDLGTRLRGLAVSYHEDHLSEYRRFRPDFAPQSPAFLAEIATFYCTGDFHGFGVEDLRLSPRLLGWLEHELSYGETQREITRRWLAYLSGGRICYTPRQLAAPVAVRAVWKRKLLDDLGAMLWEKVKQGRRHALGRALGEGEGWRSPERQAADFRFVNCNAFSPAALARAAERRRGRESFEYLFSQYVSGFDRERFDGGKLPRLAAARRERDFGRLAQLCAGEERVVSAGPGGAEPRDLLVLN
ncbi:MAG TPA: hypothetical protein VLX28_24355, partial [Thermoanaerobaculia bacterium]|nr:hypothetical protein [Thermoanaerobaculia bacterium]